MNAVSPSPAAVDSLNPLSAGTRLQEFVIERAIGIGGFGIVYQANDTLLHRKVAIKEYMPTSMAIRGDAATVSLRSASYAEDFEQGKATFIDEARMLARFKHPALIEVFRYWEQNQTAYMATPFYQGSTLKARLREKPGVPNETALKLVLLPVLDALEHMHREQVYHRDISPDNIMVLDDGTPILLDLGAARRLEVNQAQAFTVLVKPGYAPIEQYAGDVANLQGPWTDLYGWGASAYFALLGKPPPPAASRVMNDSIIKLAGQKLPGYSHDFLAAIDATLAVRPDDRPQSVAELRALLAMETPLELIPASASEANVSPPRVQLRDLTSRPDDELQEAFVQVFAATEVRANTAEIDDFAAGVPDSTETLLDADRANSQVALDVGDADARPVADQTVADQTVADQTVVKPVETFPTFGSVLAFGALALIAAFWWFAQPDAANVSPTKPIDAAELNKPASLANADVAAGNLKSEGTTELKPETQSAPEPGVVNEKPSSARFVIKPWGEIYINGEHRGVSPPLKTLTLPAGEYSVEIRNGDYPAHKTKFKLKPGQIFTINHAFVDATKK